MTYSIEEIRAKATPIAIKYGLASLSLFGSYARGEANEKSDIDFYIEKGNLKSLFEHSGLILDLEDVFDKKVDVVIISSISNQDFYQAITKEGIKLYEQK